MADQCLVVQLVDLDAGLRHAGQFAHAVDLLLRQDRQQCLGRVRAPATAPQLSDHAGTARSTSPPVGRSHSTPPPRWPPTSLNLSMAVTTGASAISMSVHDHLHRCLDQPVRQFLSRVSANTQDGYATGQLSGFSIGADGVITGRYTNGQTRAQGQIALATFTNPQGLHRAGRQRSGPKPRPPARPSSARPKSGNLGALQSGALEDSNVDLTSELVNMITAQRVYQANAQTVKTEDQVHADPGQPALMSDDGRAHKAMAPATPGALPHDQECASGPPDLHSGQRRQVPARASGDARAQPGQCQHHRLSRRNGRPARRFRARATAGTRAPLPPRRPPAPTCRQGPMISTSRNPLDVAVLGKGWLAVQGTDGSEAYTRNGSFQVGPQGALKTVQRHADRTGHQRPDHRAGRRAIKVTVAADGTISAVKSSSSKTPVSTVGQLKLVNPPTPRTSPRASTACFASKVAIRPMRTRPSRSPAAASKAATSTSIESMVGMIGAARQFELQMKMLTTAEQQRPNRRRRDSDGRRGAAVL